MTLLAQQKFTISGYVEDATSGEKLLSAAVVETQKQVGITTNTYGFFSLTLPEGVVNLQLSFVGYTPQNTSFILRGDTFMLIRLTPDATLQTLEVSATRKDRIDNQTQMSQISLPIAQIKKMPSLLGETDILKALQLLPGVKFGTEGSTGLYVRGGSNDQNLILLDGVPVYNASHFGGIFSVFNADAIKNVQITTGGFPARYGGRLSSVIEIDMKEGNMRQLHAEASIGVISSKLMVEGPIIKDKMSFMVSGRRTYYDLFLRSMRKNEIADIGNSSELQSFALFFYDLNAKVNYKINEKHRLYLSAYNGKDKSGESVSRTEQIGPEGKRQQFRYLDKESYQWGNLTAAFRWNWLASSKLFVNTALTRSTYNFGIDNYAENENFSLPDFTKTPSKTQLDYRYDSDVKDWAFKSDADYILSPKHHLRMGVGGTYHRFSPGTYRSITSVPKEVGLPTMIHQDTTIGNALIKAFEPYAYLEDEVKLGKLTANVGLHAGFFFVDKIVYPSVQPRLSLLYKATDKTSFKASFATMQQFVNLLTNDGLGFPTDLWVSSTRQLKPQKSWQAAVGYAATLGNQYELTVEGYYKSMRNVVAYKEGASYIDRVDLEPWEQKVTQGTGEAYGLETFLRKKTGKTTGWISYTWSWNYRQFDDINGGKRFPFRYDRRHEIAIVANHQLTRRLSFSWNWVFATSNPISIPVALYQFPLIDPSFGYLSGVGSVTVYGERNNYRPALYHRLDINLDYEWKRKNRAHKLSCGAFNTYNRQNPFYFDVQNDTRSTPSQLTTRFGQTVYYNDPRVRLKQVSLIPILPHLSYSIKI